MSIFRRFRQHVGWSQQRLADELGMTKGAISFWETGGRIPTPDAAYSFLRIAKTNGFSASLEDVYPPPKWYTAA